MATGGGVAAHALIGGGKPGNPVVNAEMAALAESVTAPLAVMDVTGRLRGREAILESLVQKFGERDGGGRVHLLHGLGGSGKTSIAAEVARRVSATGTAVWWVSAVDGASLASGLHAVARLAGAGTDELKPEAGADVVWRWLSTRQEPWLLVVDNADDLRVLDVPSDDGSGALKKGRGWVRPFLNSPGFVIVTSRRGGDPAQWGNWIVPHAIGMLDPADGAQVLFDHTRGRCGSPAEARALAERLGGLPLALSLAGSYLAASVDDPWPEPTAVTTFKAYREALDEGRVDILEPRDDGEGDDAPEDASRLLIDGIWQLTVQLLQSRNLPSAGSFMRLLAQFAAAPIPYRLLLERETLTGSPIFADLTHLQMRSLLQNTSHLDLIDLTTTVPTTSPTEDDIPLLYVHPLMRDASYRYRDPANDDDAYLSLAARLLSRAVAEEPDSSPEDNRKWPVWQLLAPHAFHLMRSISGRPVVDGPLAADVTRVADLSARYLHVRGLSAQARAEYDVMHRICADLLGPEHPRTLAARHGIATLLADGGEYAVAQAEFEGILDLRRQVLGDEHPDTLTTQHNLASVLYERGHHATAQVRLEEVLGLRRRVLGDEHPYTLTTRHRLARAIIDRGDHIAAEAELRDILAIERRVLDD